MSVNDDINIPSSAALQALVAFLSAKLGGEDLAKGLEETAQNMSGNPAMEQSVTLLKSLAVTARRQQERGRQ